MSVTSYQEQVRRLQNKIEELFPISPELSFAATREAALKRIFLETVLTPQTAALGAESLVLGNHLVSRPQLPLQKWFSPVTGVSDALHRRVVNSFQTKLVQAAQRQPRMEESIAVAALLPRLQATKYVSEVVNQFIAGGRTREAYNVVIHSGLFSGDEQDQVLRRICNALARDPLCDWSGLLVARRIADRQMRTNAVWSILERAILARRPLGKEFVEPCLVVWRGMNPDERRTIVRRARDLALQMDPSDLHNATQIAFVCRFCDPDLHAEILAPVMQEALRLKNYEAVALAAMDLDPDCPNTAAILQRTLRALLVGAKDQIIHDAAEEGSIDWEKRLMPRFLAAVAIARLFPDGNESQRRAMQCILEQVPSQAELPEDHPHFAAIVALRQTVERLRG